MKQLFFLFTISFLASCNQQAITKIMAKTPKLDYEKPFDYDQMNDYQKDAVYLIEIIRNSYPRLHTKISEEEFLKANTELVYNLGQTTSQIEFETRMKRYMALLKDGHSRYSSFEYSLGKEKMFFSWYIMKEKDDWIITSVDKSLDSTIVGHKVIAINDIPMNKIEGMVDRLEEGENYYYRYATFRDRVYFPMYWKALGVIQDERKISFTIERDKQVESHTLIANPTYSVYKEQREEAKSPFTNKQNDGYSYKINQSEDYAYLQMNTSLDYVSIKSDIKNYTNFFTRPIAMLYLKKEKKDALNFGKILQKVFTEIDTNNINNLIVDLRYNGGGDERTGKQLIWYLTEREDIKGFTDYLQVSEYYKKTAKVDIKKYNKLYEKKYNKSLPNGEINLTQEFYDVLYFDDITEENSPFLLDYTLAKFKGSVYIITGPNTFSAAQWLATTFADNNLAKIVGTPSGNMPSCQTGASLLKLPLTKSLMSLSYLYAERPDKSKNQEVALYPDIEVFQTYDDLLKGIDSEFEAILKEIEKQ